MSDLLWAPIEDGVSRCFGKSQRFYLETLFFGRSGPWGKLYSWGVCELLDDPQFPGYGAFLSEGHAANDPEGRMLAEVRCRYLADALDRLVTALDSGAEWADKTDPLGRTGQSHIIDVPGAMLTRFCRPGSHLVEPTWVVSVVHPDGNELIELDSGQAETLDAAGVAGMARVRELAAGLREVVS